MTTEYEKAREMLSSMKPDDQLQWLAKHTNSSVQHIKFDVNQLLKTRHQAFKFSLTSRGILIGHFVDQNGILYEIKAYQKQHVIAGNAVPERFSRGFNSFVTFLEYAKARGIDRIIKNDQEAIQQDVVITLERMLSINPREIERADNFTYLLNLHDFETILTASKGMFEYGSLNWMQNVAFKNTMEMLPVIA